MNSIRHPHLSRRWDDELYHHGIIGQRWGIRRWQNKDGTYNEAGKKRYFGSQGTKKTLSDRFEDYQKKQLKKQFDIDDETLKNTKLKDLDVTQFRPKHETNSKSEARKFVANLAMDALVPGMQVYLPLDIYRGGKALVGHVKSKKYAEEREGEPIDEKTGFHLKTKELSEKDDLKRVNPDINDFNSNSKSNCVLCTMTCEMRNRGYDVTANKAGIGYFDREIGNFFKGYKTEHIDNPKFAKKFRDPDADKGANAYGGGGKDYAARVIDKIEKSQPEGARGNISVVWAGMFGGGGHSMYYEIKNGKLIVKDGQIGKIYTDPTKILKMTTSVDIGRLDNLQFNPEGIKECCK